MKNYGVLKDFLQPAGRLGYFAQELLVYDNKDKPCPKCGTKIDSLVIGKRNSFFVQVVRKNNRYNLSKFNKKELTLISAIPIFWYFGK